MGKEIICKDISTANFMYKKYIDDHRNNVERAFYLAFDFFNNYANKYGPAKKIFIKKILDAVHVHDMSKYYHDEFDAYRAKFYPTESEIKNSDPDLVKANFKKAWTHHYKTNRHHPEYFIESHSTIDTDPVALMEMLCDWLGMSIPLSPDDPFKSLNEWFDKNKEEKFSIIGDCGKNIVESFMDFKPSEYAISNYMLGLQTVIY